MFPIIPAKHPLRSSFHVTLLIRRSHWLLVHSDPLFPASFLDSLPFRLSLSPSIFTHSTSSDTAFHFSFILPFSQKCRGERVSGGAVLQRMAETIQQQGWSQAKMSSIERRLERFLANEQVEVRTIWKAFLGEVLPYWTGKKLTFVLDCTPYTAQFTIVYLGLLVHSRVLPVAWAVMPGQESWEERQWDIVARLLDTVRAFLPQAGW